MEGGAQRIFEWNNAGDKNTSIFQKVNPLSKIIFSSGLNSIKEGLSEKTKARMMSDEFVAFGKATLNTPKNGRSIEIKGIDHYKLK